MNYRDRDWLYEHYINQDKTAQQIADLFGVKENTILHWVVRLKLTGIKKRGAIKPEHRRKVSLAKIGHLVSVATRRKISLAKLGKPCSSSTKFTKGPGSPTWRGGVMKENEKARRCHRYFVWRKKVLLRDGYKCVFCGSGEKLQADHIKQFAYYPELRFEISNGRTLCTACHMATETYGRMMAL